MHFHSRKSICKKASGKWRPFCLGLNVLPQKELKQPQIPSSRFWYLNYGYETEVMFAQGVEWMLGKHRMAPSMFSSDDGLTECVYYVGSDIFLGATNCDINIGVIR